MSYIISLFLLLVTSPILVASLQCRHCPGIIPLTYTLTSDTVPSFDDCELVTAVQCQVTIFWLENPNYTFIKLFSNNNSLTDNSLRDVVILIAQMTLNATIDAFTVTYDLVYGCTLSEECNGQANLKRILSSTVLRQNFLAELSPLIAKNESFNPDSAATCVQFMNTTERCPVTDLSTCQRCMAVVDQRPSGNVEVCASCPNKPGDQNTVMRQSFFILNNRTLNDDRVLLSCQQNGCNSMENINKIRQASSMTFDFSNYFNDSTTVTATPGTTATVTATPGTTITTTSPSSTASNIVSVASLLIFLTATMTF